MASICPKDMRECPDDVCRGTGTCAQSGAELMERCAVCGHVYSRDYDIECACESDDEPEDVDTCSVCGGDGLVHDCGEDTCCCADPSPNVECDECGGSGEIGG